jgi:hypothetical protein
MGVWQGVAMYSLKFHLGLPCLPFLCPAGGPPLKAVSGGGLTPSGRAACCRFPPIWTPHTVSLCVSHKLTPWIRCHPRVHHVKAVVRRHPQVPMVMSIGRRTLPSRRLQIRHGARGRRVARGGRVATGRVRVERHLQRVGGAGGERRD